MASEHGSQGTEESCPLNKTIIAILSIYVSDYL